MGNARASPAPTAPISSPTAPSSATTPSHAHSNSIDKKSSISDFRSPTKPAIGQQYGTAPVSSDKNNYGYGSTNEFGERERKRTGDSGPTTFAAQTIGATGYNAPLRARAGSGASNDIPAARPRSSGGRAGNPTSRLTLMNPTEEELREMEAEAERSARRQPSTILESPVVAEASAQLAQTQSVPNPQRTPTPKTTAPKKEWLSAEKEKELLYQRAVEKVARVQGTRVSVDVSLETIICLVAGLAHMLL